MSEPYYDGFTVGPVETKGKDDKGDAKTKEAKDEKDRGHEFFYMDSEYTVQLRTMEQVLELGSPYMVHEYVKWAKVDLDKRGQDGTTYLHQAAAIGDPDKIKVLIDLGMNPNAKDDYDCTPLHYVSASQEQELTLFEKGMHKLGFEPRRYGKSAEMLIENGADIDAKDKDGNTPLHFTAESKMPRVADTLLRNGADPTVWNNDKKTAADVAMEHGNNNLAMQLDPNKDFMTREVKSPQTLAKEQSKSKSKEHEMEI